MLYINSANRDIDSASVSDFRVTFAESLIRGASSEKLSCEVTDVCMNRSWYTFSATVNSFQVNGVTLSLPVGYYTVASLRSELVILLNTITPGWTVGYTARTNTFTYGPALATPNISYTFTFNNAIAALLGFRVSDTPTVVSGSSMTSYLPVKVNLESTVLVHSDLPKTRCASLDNAVDANSAPGISVFRESDVLISVPITVSGFDNISYTTSGSGIYSADLALNYLHRLRFWVTDELGNPLSLQYDWTLALKLSFTSTSGPKDSLPGDVKRISDDVRLMILSDPEKYSQQDNTMQDDFEDLSQDD